MTLPNNIQTVLDSVLGTDGESTPALRSTAFTHELKQSSVSDVSGTLEAYLDKLITEPSKIVDADINSLMASGFTEDQIFELTIAAALGTGVSRYQHTLALIENAATP